MCPSLTDPRADAGQHVGSEVPTCDMCSHPVEFHDAIALRYCAATASSALSRGCMCRVPAPVT